MTRIQSLAVLAASAIAVQGHCKSIQPNRHHGYTAKRMVVTFIRLAHNGEWKAPTQYIRYVPTLTQAYNGADIPL